MITLLKNSNTIHKEDCCIHNFITISAELNSCDKIKVLQIKIDFIITKSPPCDLKILFQ